MKSAKFVLGAAACLILTTTASAGEGALVTAPLVHPACWSIVSTLAHSGRDSELAALQRFPQILGPAQIHNEAWRHRFRKLTVSATSLSFGNITLNSVSTQSITLKSTGSASVTLEALTVAGAGFAVAHPALPLTLWPGQSATIAVSFDPKVTGAATGTLSILSNSSTGSTIAVSLNGTGAGATANPVLTLSPTSLNFGSIAVGTPITQSVTLTSAGKSAVTVSAESLTGAGFTVSGATFPVTLNPTIAIKVQVQFDPTVVGTAAGTLTFKSNSATGSSSVVTLSGTGAAVQHQVTLNWSAPASSPVPVSGYNVYRAAAGSTSFLLLNASADAQTSYIDQNVQAGSSYSYYVKSVDSAGVESVPSNQVSVTVP